MPLPAPQAAASGRNFKPFAAAALAAGLILLPACETGPEAGSDAIPVSAPAPEMASPPIVATQSIGERAMATARSLEADGNTQAAIDRLTNALGSPALSDTDTGDILVMRSRLKAGRQGYDVYGAIEDLDELEGHTGSLEPALSAERDMLRGRATSLNTVAESPRSSRTDRFMALFELGDHETAIEEMRQSDLSPPGDVLLAMYQIGYLCQDAALTGRAYPARDEAGMPVTLQFCDTGK